MQWGQKPFWLNMSISESAGTICAEKARLRRLCALAESSHQLAIQQLTWIRDRFGLAATRAFESGTSGI
jgi:hypothetical protein